MTNRIPSYKAYSKHTKLIRPIVSSINSVPCKLAKTIAKVITLFLGTINPTNNIHSGDLIQKTWKHKNGKQDYGYLTYQIIIH